MTTDTEGLHSNIADLRCESQASCETHSKAEIGLEHIDS